MYKITIEAKEEWVHTFLEQRGLYIGIELSGGSERKVYHIDDSHIRGSGEALRVNDLSVTHTVIEIKECEQ